MKDSTIKAYEATAVVIMAAALSFMSMVYDAPADAKEAVADSSDYMYMESASENEDERLTLWYSDDALTAFIKAACADYFEDTGVRVTPVLSESANYMDDIADISSAGDAFPDLFLTNNGNLEMAALLGIAVPLEDENNLLSEEKLPMTAINAVTYKGKRVAYPLYFDTSVFLYNRSYIENYAKDRIEAERAQEAADKAEDGAEPEDTAPASEQEVEAFADEMVPHSFDDIEALADEYDAPEGVESILLWEDEDIFYDFFILGGSIDLGGACGDDEALISVKNEDSIRDMVKYYQMVEFFSLGEEDKNYEQIRDGFLEGKYLFTIASTDILKGLEDMQWESRVIPIPQVRENAEVSALSVTDCVCVNGYSSKIKAAEGFAEFLTTGDRQRQLYERCGRLSPYYSATELYPQGKEVLAEYARSTPAPKLMREGDFWMKLEIAFMKIAQGVAPRVVMGDLEYKFK